MYAALTTAALFTGVILNDLYSTYDATASLKHFLFGFIATVMIGILEVKGFGPVAWGLLIAPIAVITSVFSYVIWNPVQAPAPPPLRLLPKAEPKPEPKIQLPDTPYKKRVCRVVDAKPPSYKPPELPQCGFAEDGTPIMPPVKQTLGAAPARQELLTKQSSVAAPLQPESTTDTLNQLASTVKLNLTPVTSCG